MTDANRNNRNAFPTHSKMDRPAEPSPPSLPLKKLAEYHKDGKPIVKSEHHKNAGKYRKGEDRNLAVIFSSKAPAASQKIND